MESLADCLLVILKTNGEDGLKYWPPKDKKKIFVGSDPTCDIRINHDLIKNKHFSIYIDSFGKVKAVNAPQPAPLLFFSLFVVVFLLGK